MCSVQTFLKYFHNLISYILYKTELSVAMDVCFNLFCAHNFDTETAINGSN